jgi:hypothetical protein
MSLELINESIIQFNEWIVLHPVLSPSFNSAIDNPEMVVSSSVPITFTTSIRFAPGTVETIWRQYNRGQESELNNIVIL